MSVFVQFVIPACLYGGSTGLATLSLSKWNPGVVRNWTPDPFDVAQGRGEPSRTTIRTFGGDDLNLCLSRSSYDSNAAMMAACNIFRPAATSMPR